MLLDELDDAIQGAERDLILMKEMARLLLFKAKASDEFAGGVAGFVRYASVPPAVPVAAPVEPPPAPPQPAGAPIQTPGFADLAPPKPHEHKRWGDLLADINRRAAESENPPEVPYRTVAAR